MGLDSNDSLHVLHNVYIHCDLEALQATANYYDHVQEVGSCHQVDRHV